MSGATRLGSEQDAAFWNELYAKVGNRAIATHTGHDADAFDESGRADTDFVVGDFFGGVRRGRVLEIGCGAGRMTRHLADAFAEVTALDCTAAVLDELRRNLGDRAGVTAVEGSELTLRDQPDGSFDAVLAYVVFQHISSRDSVREYVVQSARLLAPGGVAALQFRRNGLRARAADAAGWVGRAFSHRALNRSWRGHRYSTARIRAMADQPGCSFEIRDRGRHRWLILRREGTPAGS